MILTDATDAAAVYLDDLVANPDNPRQNLGDITELAESIRELGIITPLLVVALDHELGGDVTPYMVVDGHRRLAALRSIDFDDTIPVRIVEMNRTQRLLAALATQGKPLDPLDEARAYQALIDLDLTQRQIAERVGCNQSHVSRRLALLELDDDTKAAVADGKTKLRDAEAKARGKEPAKPKPAAVGVDYVQATGWRDKADRLEVENAALREIAAKAREAVVEVKAALAEQPAPLVATLEATAPLGYAILWREPGEQEWSTVESVIFDAAEVDPQAIGVLEPNDEWIVVALHSVAGALPAALSHPVDDLPGMWDDSDLSGGSTDCEPLPSADIPPEWLTKQPWGSYDMSADQRLLGVIAKATKIDTCRRVVVYEQGHDGRVAIIEAALARINELSRAVAA